MFITNNRASFYLCWKENLVKHQKVSKYYENDCSSNSFEKQIYEYLVKNLYENIMLVFCVHKPGVLTPYYNIIKCYFFYKF